MNSIFINGKPFSVTGNNISVNQLHGVVAVSVNGVRVESFQNTNDDVTIRFEGDLASLDCHNAVVSGEIKGNVNAHNVTCGKVLGNVSAHNVSTT